MKTTQIISLVFVLTILGCSLKPNSDSETAKIIKIDDVIESPENFKGTISVSGIVLNTDKSKNYFEIGCEDACVYLPVQYAGELPKDKKKLS